jgi:hypothetical protein
MASRSPRLNAEMPTDVRHVVGVGWQVHLKASQQWHTCRGELDACFLASGIRKSEAVVRGELAGEEVAEELDAVAMVAERNFGPGGGAEISSAAQLARGGSVSGGSQSLP